MRILVIINGKKKLSAQNEQIIDRLRNHEKVTLSEHRTTAPLNAINHVQRNLMDGDTVVCVGGDGTCNEVVNGIILSQRSEIKLAILPDGTGNDFIRSTKIPGDDFANRIIESKGQLIDVGKVSNSGGLNRYFLNIAGFGLDGKVVEIMDRQRANGFGGGMSYSSAIIRGFFAFKKPEIELIADEFNYKGSSLLVAFCNGHTYGNGLKVCPDARVDDGQMEVCVFGDLTVWHYIKYLSKIKKGYKIDHPEVHYYSSNKVTVKHKGTLPGQLDGEFYSFEDSEIELFPSKLFLINEIDRS